MKKKIIIIAVSALTFAAAIGAGFLTHSFAVSGEARAQFKSGLNSLISQNAELEQKKDDLKSEIEKNEQIIESKNEISAEADEYLNQLDTLKADVDAANRELIELDESIKKKQEYIDRSGSIKKPTKGRSVSLSGRTLNCPDDIAAGRYIASGKGNLLIYNSSKKLRISENLSTIETNSFTFDLEEGESVEATESITLTVLK